MSADRKPSVRCAIYTRKSSEEGLEQSFNSLHAQREACQAYIASQRHEGWRALDAQYDDGGYSGATMDRPAVKRLLEDIEAGGVDVVIVYKVDRLTRSLSDFARTIDIFDAHKVSFVSVTQQFNTTSSMGRLTLNVLLSFAQFEREVAGERIRDKIAASKRKGMWMGGMVPLGYDLDDRKLIVNREEAERVRHIYRAYLRVGCVAKLKAYLDRTGIKSKMRVSRAGRKSGGASYSRGALYELLQNRVYLGEIIHRDQSFLGQHDAILSRQLWENVQAQLKSNNDSRRNGINARDPSLLAGLIRDEQGNRYTPSPTLKDGKRYRYYVSQAAIHHRSRRADVPARIPAHEIELAVSARLQAFLFDNRAVVDALSLASCNAETTRALVNSARKAAKSLQTGTSAERRQLVGASVSSVTVRAASIELRVKRQALIEALLGSPPPQHRGNASTTSPRCDDEPEFPLHIDARVSRCGGEVKLVLEGTGSQQSAQAVPSVIKALARAHAWYNDIVHDKSNGRRSIGKRAQLDERYVSLIMRCAFLAPDLVQTILDGHAPASLTLAKLSSRLPMDWELQKQQLRKQFF